MRVIKIHATLDRIPIWLVIEKKTNRNIPVCSTVVLVGAYVVGTTVVVALAPEREAQYFIAPT